MKNWKHLTFEQRKAISNGISHNYKLKEIAETLGFDPTSISKEVKRNRESTTIGKNITNCKRTRDSKRYINDVVIFNWFRNTFYYISNFLGIQELQRKAGSRSSLLLYT